ncbi:MAG: acyl-CoA dehydrogenase, partial [Candidatus Eisenbacteria bacterium]|nr:acyl-CoA dehydrogenase [Candidatus Eisenbacteria bacterium]
MDFSLSSEQEQLQELAQEFARNEMETVAKH